MTIWSKQNLSGAGMLVIAMMLANFINFVFNAFLGRVLSFEDFGTLVFYSTILNIAGIAFGALGTTMNHRIAYLNGKYEREAGTAFARMVRGRATCISIGLMALWVSLAWVIADLFNLQSVVSVIMFAPVFLFGLITSINKGYLQGNLYFLSGGLILLIEALKRLLSGAALVFLNLPQYVHLSMPFSLLSAVALSAILIYRSTSDHTSDNQFRFPKRFYLASILNGVSAAAFLSVDVVLAKHYLSAGGAGEYALLSLAASMIYFAGSILNGFMITFISHDDGEHVNPQKTFKWLFLGSLGIVSVSFVVVGVLGAWSVPLLFGAKAVSIVPYLLKYTFAISLFTLSSTVISYHLARHHFSFSLAVMVVPVILCFGIFLNHGGVGDLVNVYFISSLIGSGLIFLMHFLQNNQRFVLANLVDLINLFMPLKGRPIGQVSNGGKRILVFNWRDTKHSFAGGAEVYVHELAKRWVRDGNHVTLFCGNDGKSTREEVIDGVNIIRRGGFYFVYFWAFVYYLRFFRGRFDLILDCQSGIPFFTPLYAKEEVYSLLFHVHQEVFFKHLPKPLAWFASVIENRLMPYVYRHTQFITISESSKSEMENLGIRGSGIEVVFPGVDLGAMKPGVKSLEPTILYLGRLKAYKSVDVLIKAFKKVVEKVGSAKLFIAGSGEDEARLRKITTNLGLDSKVEFLGAVPEYKKILLMQSAWVFVNPSMMEGWGITVIESSAVATPVVASDVPGLRDSIKNPHTGFLVPYGDVDQFAEKILLLLENKNIMSEMSVNAVKWANKFDWNKSSKSFEGLFQI